MYYMYIHTSNIIQNLINLHFFSLSLLSTKRKEEIKQTSIFLFLIIRTFNSRNSCHNYM